MNTTLERTVAAAHVSVSYLKNAAAKILSILLLVSLKYFSAEQAEAACTP